MKSSLRCCFLTRRRRVCLPSRGQRLPCGRRFPSTPVDATTEQQPLTSSSCTWCELVGSLAGSLYPTGGAKSTCETRSVVMVTETQRVDMATMRQMQRLTCQVNLLWQLTRVVVESCRGNTIMRNRLPLQHSNELSWQPTT